MQIHSGKLLIAAILAAALVSAAVSWWFRYSSTHRALEFWGPEAARLIRDAPHVTLTRFAAGGDGSPLESRRDISQAPGLTHLRYALLEDRSFDWPAADAAPVPHWATSLEFRSQPDDSEASLVLLFSPDYEWAAAAQPGTPLERAVSSRPIAGGLRKMLAPLAEGAAPSGSPLDAPNAAQRVARNPHRGGGHRSSTSSLEYSRPPPPGGRASIASSALDGRLGAGGWFPIIPARPRITIPAPSLSAFRATMRSIAIINQKGGVGKTTTAVNLSAALAREGQRVGLIDIDPQAHASLHLGLDPRAKVPTVYDVLTSDTPIAELWQPATKNLSVAASHIDLAAAEVELAGVVGREVILRDKLAIAADDFDYVLIDCPPSLGILTINALSAVDDVFLPLQPHFLALHGLSKLLKTIGLVSERLNDRLQLAGVVLCLYESGTKLAAEVSQDVDDFFREARRGGHRAWRSVRLFETRIRRNIRLAEAPSFGQSIFDYSASSPGAEDYRALGGEVLAYYAGRAMLAEQAA